MPRSKVIPDPRKFAVRKNPHTQLYEQVKIVSWVRSFDLRVQVLGDTDRQGKPMPPKTVDRHTIVLFCASAEDADIAWGLLTTIDRDIRKLQDCLDTMRYGLTCQITNIMHERLR